MPDDTPQPVSPMVVSKPAVDATQPAVPAAPAAPASVTPAPVPQPAPVVPDISLDQFAIELSHRDKRVELINAFVFVERRAGRVKDSKSAYQSRFDAFIHQPV